MPITSDNTTITITHPTSPDTSVTILKYGATVLSWKVNGHEKLFLSDSAKLDGSKAVRGGIPLVFPRFGPASGKHAATDSLPQHGFARTSVWEFLGQIDDTTAQLALSPDQLNDEFRKQWVYDFTLLYTVKLADPTTLEISMDVENPGSQPFEFNVLFHTYFRIPDISKTTVEGLNNLVFYNKVVDADDHSDTKPITIDGEVDRVYKSAPQTSVITSDSKPYFTITASKTLTDTVVWNPWKKGAEGLADFTPKSGYQNMVCVENGNVSKFTELQTGDKWNGTVNLKAHI